jgi:hypothetical protein
MNLRHRLARLEEATPSRWAREQRRFIDAVIAEAAADHDWIAVRRDAQAKVGYTGDLDAAMRADPRMIAFCAAVEARLAGAP